MFACTNMDRPFDINLLDKLFKPSCWSKRYSTPEQVESEHIAFTKNGKNSDCVSYCLHIWIKQRCISKYLFIPCIFVEHFFVSWFSIFLLIDFNMRCACNFEVPWRNSIPHEFVWKSIDLLKQMLFFSQSTWVILWTVFQYLQYWFKMQTACIYLSKFKYLLHFAIGRETIFASYLSKMITTTTNKRPTESKEAQLVVQCT